jgi:acyl-CoA hydrolase
MPTRTLSDSYTEMTEMVLPNDTNTFGRALGGAVLHWMDIAAAIAAMRFSGHPCVTASMDNVDFVSPIDLGELAVVQAYVFNTGRTSMDVRVDVFAEDATKGERRTATTSFFTFVALDDDGVPTAVPDLVCEDDSAETLRDRAVALRKEHLEDVSMKLARVDGQ